MNASEMTLSPLPPPSPLSTASTATAVWLTSGPPASMGPEPLASHRARLGARPHGGSWLLDVVAQSGLRGRGGAWFSTHRKLLRALTQAPESGMVLVVNGEEGEPLSAKDKWLLQHRPHLVVDGALLLAETLGARSVTIYLARGEGDAYKVLRRALNDRRMARDGVIPVHLLQTAPHYVAGESSAVANRVLRGEAKPTGQRHSSVLVHNVETVANVAMLAINGPDRFRQMGTETAPGSALVTIGGAVQRPGVYEINIGSPLLSILEKAGLAQEPEAVLLGGYAGNWVGGDRLAASTYDPDLVLAGCGVISVLPRGECGLRATADISRYLARETAGQCGPCVFGLPAIAGAMERVARGHPHAEDETRLRRWCGQVRGRGACHHPDGAASIVMSALETFAADLEAHLRWMPCEARRHTVFPSPPRRRRAWL